MCGSASMCGSEMMGKGKKERERNVAVINYRYDGTETPPLHTGYYVLYVMGDI